MIKNVINQLLIKISGYQIEKSYKLDLDHRLKSDEKRIISNVSKRTMTNPNSLANLISATKYLNNGEIEGAFVECGVWRGGSALAFCLASLEAGVQSRLIYLFDTFEGYTNTGERDFQISDGVKAEVLFNKDPNYVCSASLIDVQNGFKEIGYPNELIHYIVGDIIKTPLDKLPDKIALLRLDTDYYHSTLWELENLYPRLVSGGVLIIDDYDHWNGSRQACDEYFKKAENRNFISHMEYGRIMIKYE